MFRFRLQRVLEIREKTEKEKAAKLAAARSAAEAAREAQDRLEAVRTESAGRLVDANGGGTPIGELRNLSYMLEVLNQQIQEARSVSEAADETVRRLSDEFTAAFRERRVLDRLRDRKQAEWKTNELASNRRAMDGVAIARFRRSEPTTSEES